MSTTTTTTATTTTSASPASRNSEVSSSRRRPDTRQRRLPVVKETATDRELKTISARVKEIQQQITNPPNGSMWNRQNELNDELSALVQRRRALRDRKKEEDVASGNTPQNASLLRAVDAGRTQLVKEYLAEGADVNFRGRSRETPLMIAARGGYESIVRALLQAGAYVNDISFTRRTALIYAVDGGYDSITDILLEAGANNTGDWTIVLKNAGKRGDTSIIPKLLDMGVDINNITGGSTYTPITALEIAAKGGHESMVRALLDMGIDVNAANGKTALILAVIRKHESIARMLIQAGADVGADMYRRTALIFAADNGLESIVRMLIEAGANVNAVNAYGETALSKAADHGYVSIMRMLVNAGVDVNMLNKAGVPVLAGKSINTVQALLDMGADPNIKDSGGKSVLSMFVDNHSYDTAVALMDAGAYESDIVIRYPPHKSAVEYVDFYNFLARAVADGSVIHGPVDKFGPYEFIIANPDNITKFMPSGHQTTQAWKDFVYGQFDEEWQRMIDAGEVGRLVR